MENTEHTKIDFTNFDIAIAELEKQALKLASENIKLKKEVVELNDFVSYLIKKYNNIE